MPMRMRILAQRGDEMGIGDDLVRRDGKAATMADIEGLAILFRDQHDAHDRAAGGLDIGGIGGERQSIEHAAHAAISRAIKRIGFMRRSS